MSETVGKIKVTLVKSVIGTQANHRSRVRGLGLKRIGHSVVVNDTPSIRGMVNCVRFLVKSEVV